MNNNQSEGKINFVLSLVVVFRVAIVLIIWLGLFLAMFLGYFTVPILVIGFVAIIYAIVDIGIFMIYNQRLKIDMEMRKTFSEKLDEHSHLESEDLRE